MILNSPISGGSKELIPLDSVRIRYPYKADAYFATDGKLVSWDLDSAIEYQPDLPSGIEKGSMIVVVCQSHMDMHNASLEVSGEIVQLFDEPPNYADNWTQLPTPFIINGPGQIRFYD